MFEGVQTDTPFDGYFEVYLGLPRDGRLDSDSPYYVGNLALFGADPESRHSAMPVTATSASKSRWT